MPTLKGADNVRRGTVQVERIYRGSTLVWEHEVAVVVTLQAVPTSINEGEVITLTATLDKPGATTGSMNFRSGSPSGPILAVVHDAPWTAQVSPAASGPLYAEYLGSDPYLPAVSAGVPVAVAGSTTLVLSSNKSTVGPNESATLTAAISGVTTGTVQFRTGSPTGPIIASVTDAPWTTVVTPNANVTYYATYVANANHQAATSNALFLDYVIPTSISLAASKTSVNQGEATVLTATVTGANTGTVRFRTGSAAGPIVATATSYPFTASIVPTADTTYYATYDASADYAASASAGVAVAFSIPTSISLAANPTTVEAGSSITLTATVSGASSGTVEFRRDSPTGQVVGTDTGSPWSITVAPTGDTTYYAVYLANGDYLRSESAGVAVDRVITTSISLGLSAGTINNGQAVTLTATVSGAPSGTIYIRAGSPAGAVVASGAGPAFQTALAPASTTVYYAEYVANGDYKQSVSAPQQVTVRQLTTKTWSGNATWSQSYSGANAKRDDGYLYYGYVSSVWDNQKSLIGFDVPSLAAAVDVTSVRLRFYNVHHYMNSGGDIIIALHDYTAEPATWESSRVDNNEQTVDSAPKPGWVDESLNATIRGKFKSGAAKGIGLGPGTSDSTQFYGYADMHTATNKPWLEIKWTEWV